MSTGTGETAKLAAKGKILDRILELRSMPKTIKEQIDVWVKEKLASMKDQEAIPYEIKDEGYLRPCHWCDGVMRDTPTSGRLECANCGAVSLCGRQLSFEHVKGSNT